MKIVSFYIGFKIAYGFAILVFLTFDGCSGCSRSGLRNHASKNSEGSTDYSYTSPNAEAEIDRNSNPKNNIQPSNLNGNSLTELFKRNKSAVFMIYTSDGEKTMQGSGFFVSSTGIGISNYHVFEGTSQGLEVIKLASGEQLKIARILAKSNEDDYIIFKVKSHSSKNYINIAKQLPEIGEDVFAIGNPKGLEHTLSKGIVSGYRENNKYIQTTTEITHGSSGGPLMNMRGEVIGITSSGFGEANLNFAININILELNKYQ